MCALITMPLLFLKRVDKAGDGLTIRRLRERKRVDLTLISTENCVVYFKKVLQCIQTAYWLKLLHTRQYSLRKKGL